MSKKKPIIVTITKSRRPTQPWSFVIDRPGPQKGETKREWYATSSTAKRGARRKLGAVKNGNDVFVESRRIVKGELKVSVTRVEFVVIAGPKKA
jgi:hypothetical protein